MLHAILEFPLFRIGTWIPIVAIAVMLGMALMVFTPREGKRPWLRGAGLGLVSTSAVLMAFWVLNYYMPMLAPHWSQKYLFDKYFDVCVPARNAPEIDEGFRPLIADSEALMGFFEPHGKRNCKDEVISWLLTWRGETFYSDNTIRPVMKDQTQFEPYLTDFNKGARFYVHIERTRAKSFKGRLDSALKKLGDKKDFKGIKEFVVTLEHDENYWFVLLKADTVCKDGYDKDAIGHCLMKTAGL